MSSYDYNDLTRNVATKQVRDTRMKKVSQVYKDAETNTNPDHKRGQTDNNQEQSPSGTTSAPAGMLITPDVLHELNMALHHLQQVVLKLGGGA